MSIRTVLLVALALLPLLAADGLHASPACGTTVVSPSPAPWFLETLSPDPGYEQSQAEALANNWQSTNSDAIDQDTTVHRQTAGVVTADWTVAAAERQPRVILF